VKPRNTQSLGEGLESLISVSGVLFLAIGLAGSAAHLVPGSFKGHGIPVFLLLGAVLILAPYLVLKRPALLLARAAQAVVLAAFFAGLFVTTGIIHAPTTWSAWGVIVASVLVIGAFLRAAPRIREASFHRRPGSDGLAAQQALEAAGPRCALAWRGTVWRRA
jgi:hypothetical protein